MKLSVNILTWNTVKTLHTTLHVLKNELQGLDAEVIIVDNGSNDGSQDYATIKNEKNLGISKGKNQGIDASKGEYILLLDGDIVPVPNSIVSLLNYLEEHKEVDALGFYPNCFTNQKNGYKAIHHEEFCNILVDVVPHVSHCIYYGIYRRSVFDRGCRMDEQYGVGYGYEDLDFFMQMKAKGIIQYVCHINKPKGKYYHEINSSIRCMGFEKYMETSKKRSLIFNEKWGTATTGAIC